MKKYLVLLPLLLMGNACPPPTPQPTPTPGLTCADLNCAFGYVCQETTTGPKCVQIVTPPPPVVSKCPIPVPTEGRWINRKPYGQGFDSTPRIRNRAYCEKMTGIDGVTDCKVNPEGSGQDACDTEFLDQPCPTWQFYNAGKWEVCTPKPHDVISCDHFDHYNEVPPYTGNCQKFPDGSPSGGFFTIAHGKGKIRACDKSGTVCSEPVDVDY